MSNEVVMAVLPNCHFCEEVDLLRPANYDAKTIRGPWAYMCEIHFLSETFGELGLGRGQRLKLADES